MRWWLVWVLLLGPAVAFAQDERPDEQVRLSLDRYARLMAAAQRTGGGTVTWGRGAVTVQLPGTVGEAARITVDARLEAFGDGPIEAVLLPADAVLESATVGGRDAALLRINGAHVALLEDAGARDVRLQYLVPTATGTDGSPFAMVPLPPLPSATLTASGGAEPEVWPGTGGSRGGDRVTATVPATPAVLVRWAGVGAGASVQRVEYRLAPDEGGDGVDVSTRFEVLVRGKRAKVRLASADTPLVELKSGNAALASHVADGWHVAELTGPGRVVIEARLKLPVDRTHGQPQVVLQPNEAPIARVEVTVPGKREVVFEPPVPLTTTVRGEGERALTTAIGHLPPLETVTLRWTEARAAPETRVRVNTDTYQLMTLQEGVLRSRVLVDYDVIYGKLKELPLALPEDVVPFKVEGEGIEDWRIFPATDDEPRHLRVVLGRELEGKLRLEVQLETSVPPQEGTPVTLPLVRPMEAARELGVIALFDGDKVGFAPATAEGYAKVGQDALPVDVRQDLRDKVNQAFKHIGAPKGITTKVATAKAREVRFDARVDTLYLVREGALTGQASVLVELKSGRRDALTLSLPEGVAEPRITAPSLNKVDPAPEGFEAGPGRKAYVVSFTQALEGAIQLDVEFELLLKKDLGEVRLPDIQVHGAEVESGAFGIAAETGMEVTAGESKDLRKVNATELPKAVRLRSDNEVALAYTFAHVPWSLMLTVQRHRTVETLNAIATQVWIETNVLESGNLVHRATYQVQNDEKQFLRLKLPAEAKVLRVAAGDRKVKAVQDEEGAVAVPLPKNATVSVDITYETRRDRLGVLGAVELVAPDADVRTNDIQWLVQVPRVRPVFRVATDLKQLPPYQWRGREDEHEAVELPVDPDSERFLFTYAVQDDAEAPLAVTLRFVAAPDRDSEPWIFVLAVLALAFVARRRAKRAPFGAADAVGLLVGVGGLVVVATLWTLDIEDGVAAMVVLLAVGWFSRVKRPKEAADEELD